MALLKVDLFDAYGSVADFDSRWSTPASDPEIETGRVFQGRAAARLLSGVRLRHTFASSIVSPATVFISCWFMYRCDHASNISVLRVGNSGTGAETNTSVVIQVNRTVRIFNAGNDVIGTSTLKVPRNEWHLWEVRASHFNSLDSTNCKTKVSCCWYSWGTSNLSFAACDSGHA